MILRPKFLPQKMCTTTNPTPPTPPPRHSILQTFQGINGQPNTQAWNLRGSTDLGLKRLPCSGVYEDSWFLHMRVTTHRKKPSIIWVKGIHVYYGTNIIQTIYANQLVCATGTPNFHFPCWALNTKHWAILLVDRDEEATDLSVKEKRTGIEGTKKKTSVSAWALKSKFRTQICHFDPVWPSENYLSPPFRALVSLFVKLGWDNNPTAFHMGWCED